MNLNWLDWIIIIAFLLMNLIIGLRLKKQAGKSLSDFFLGGRNLPWYLAGMSMVATTFAADTPLWVTEQIKESGISANWVWWNMLIGGMLTTFFFAKLWRRANVLTELEFIELRYSGAPARFLRGFKSIYMGLLLNSVIIGWVNIAFMTILHVFFDIPKDELIGYAFLGMIVVLIYSSLAGLKGVVITDAIQFVIAMAGCIILAVVVLNHEKIGGIEGLKNHFSDEPWRLDFFPSFDKSYSGLTLGIGAFFSFFFVQWWASWYPGAEPGGGGYISQRMMSAKNEQHAIWATLFFQIAHYALRPWPWIIVALCSIILFPEAEHGEGFVLVMRDYLPNGLKGLLLVAFISAYMSTISTQLNWGASYLTNDLYLRFIAKEEKKENQKHLILVARLFSLLIVLVGILTTMSMESINQAAQLMITCGAGLGAVLMLRWYWWRINAWTELTATIVPFIVYGTWAIWSSYAGSEYEEFIHNFKSAHGPFLLTVGLTTISWLVVVYVSKPTSKEVLETFYNRVRPDGVWGIVGKKAEKKQNQKNIFSLMICWVTAVTLVYGLLLGIGKLIFHEWNWAMFWIGLSFVSFLILRVTLKRVNVL